MRAVDAWQVRKAYIADVVGEAAREAKAQAVKFLDVLDRNVELEQANLQLQAKIAELEGVIREQQHQSDLRRRADPEHRSRLNVLPG